MYYALWGHNPAHLIGEFDEVAEALAIVRELLEAGWLPEDLSLGPPPGDEAGNGAPRPPILTGAALAARADASIPGPESARH